jgi:hypothetical protein
MRKILFLFMLMPVMVLAQPIVPLTFETFPDATVGNMSTYDISSILEYNDGAGVFIEFGFKSLMVQEIAWEKAKIKVEVYLMESPEAAFGIYSISVLKCLQRDTLTPCDCNGIFQYQTAYGNLYISITSETGSDAARARYLPVARAIMQLNPQQNFTFPVPFNQPLLLKGKKNLVYVEGPIGLQYILFPWQDLFVDMDFRMFAIALANSESDIYFARIQFAAPDGMFRFLRLAGLMEGDVPVPNTNTNDGLYREFKQLDNQTIYFLQSQEPWPISAVINRE